MNKDKLAHCFRSILSYISPQLNTEITYFVKFKRWINLKRPMTFNFGHRIKDPRKLSTNEGDSRIWFFNPAAYNNLLAKFREYKAANK